MLADGAELFLHSHYNLVLLTPLINPFNVSPHLLADRADLFVRRAGFPIANVVGDSVPEKNGFLSDHSDNGTEPLDDSVIRGGRRRRKEEEERRC